MAGDDLRPLQPDAEEVSAAMACAATCRPWSCVCDDLLADEDDAGPSYLVENYDVWDLVGRSAW